jgi:hypothetical protein
MPTLQNAAEVASIVSAIGAVAAVFAVLVAWSQLRASARADRLTAVAPIFAEYRAPEMRAARKVLFSRLTPDDRGTAIRDLPEDVQEAAHRIGHYLDHLGMLVYLGLIDVDQVATFLGISALNLWRLLKPYIESERKLRSPDIYLNAFESLAVALVKANPELKARRLDRWNGDWNAS